MKRCLLQVWVIQKKMTPGILLPQNGVQNKLTWKHHKWSTVNECWQRIYCHDGNDNVDKWWMVMMKWQRWQMKKSHDKNEDVGEWRFHEEIVNGHERDIFMTYSTERWKSNMLEKDMIIDKRMSRNKDDCKYQGEFTRHRRQNSMYHMKKYSRRGDKMNVRQPDEKIIVGTENLKETSLINHMITVLTDEKQIWQEWLYSMFLLKQACMKSGQWLCTIII